MIAIMNRYWTMGKNGSIESASWSAQYISSSMDELKQGLAKAQCWGLAFPHKLAYIGCPQLTSIYLVTV